MNHVIELLRQRTSLRKYAERPLSDEHLDLILESAMRAPTAGNMMLYSILVVKDPEKKRILSETCDHQPFIASAPVVLIFLADMQKWYDYYLAGGVKEFCQRRGQAFRGPDEGDLLLAACDALVAAQNAVIAAESLGIGSCYIGDIMENYETHRELLALPPWAFPIAMLTMGYFPEGWRRIPQPRFARPYVVCEERYRRLTPAELHQMLGEREARFNPANSLGAANFAQMMYGAKAGAPFAEEMARSVRQALRNWRGQELS